MMVAGIIMARYAAQDAYQGIAVLGLVQVMLGGAVLLWSAWHYDELHGPLRDGNPVIHPTAARLVGISTLVFSSVALVLAVLFTLTR